MDVNRVNLILVLEYIGSTQELDHICKYYYGQTQKQRPKKPDFRVLYLTKLVELNCPVPCDIY